MPDEDAEDDCGCRLAGGPNQSRASASPSSALGPTPGPTNKDLSTDSSRSEITAELTDLRRVHQQASGPSTRASTRRRGASTGVARISSSPSWS